MHILRIPYSDSIIKTSTYEFGRFLILFVCKLIRNERIHSNNGPRMGF